MDRGLVMGVVRRESAVFVGAATAMEEESSPSSRSISSSGCQSGWTLYLDHSDQPAQRWMLPDEEDEESDSDSDDDSMISDASSGPPRDDDEDEEPPLRCCCSSSGGVDVHRGASASASLSGSFVQGHHARRAAVEDDHDLDDTASSSAVLSCPMV